MRRTPIRRLLMLAALAAPLLGAAAAQQDDLRGLRVGMTAADLPAGAFGNFTCTDAPNVAPAGFSDWRACPADAQGAHGIRFSYASGDTMVAGHPVTLTALFDQAGRLATLKIETNSSARLFLRKKAFLLGLQALSRYGDEGWTCTEGKPDADDEPVGGVFVKQECHKTVPGKSLLVARTLLRHPNTDLKAFVGETRIIIDAAP